MKKIYQILLVGIFGIFILFIFGCDKPDNSAQCDSQFQVAFESNGGKLVSGEEKQNVCSSKNIIEPLYERYGYVFSGWDKNIDNIKEKTTVKAQWMPLLNLDGFEILSDESLYGEVGNDVKSFSFLNKINLNSNVRWKVFTDIQGQNEIITKTVNLNTGSNVFYLFIEESNDKMALYKVTIRRLELITISFNSNGGSFISNSIQIQAGDTLSEHKNNINIPVKKGYSFSGFSRDFEDEFYESTTIYALWTRKCYVATYILNNGEDSISKDVCYDSNNHFPNISKRGYTLSGWVDQNKNAASQSYTYDSDMVFTAQWDTNSYLINYKYNTNDGKYNIRFMDDESVIYEYNLTSNDRFSMPEEPTKDGYKFVGWYMDKDLTNLFFLPEHITTNLIAYARWIVIDESSKNHSVIDPSQYTSTYDTISYTANDDGHNIYFIALETKTYFMYYKLSSCYEPSAEIDVVNLTTGEVIVSSKRINECNFISQELNLSEGDVVKIYIEDAISEPKVYFYFKNFNELNNYAVLDYNSTKQNIEYDAITSLLTPNREGYVFLGWYDENDCLFENKKWELIN